MAKSLRYNQLLQLAVAEGATTPNPGSVGTIAWSTTTSRVVAWDGSKWNSGWLNYILQLALTEGATSPSPGIAGAIAWSTTLSKIMVWNGTTWNAIDTAGSGSGDVVGPSGSSDGHLLVSSGTTGKVLREATWFDTQATGIPAAPASGDLRWFARSRAGRVLPHIIGPSGIDVALQPGLFGNSIYMWLPGTGTTVAINWATSWTARNSGTGTAQAHPTKVSTNALTSLNRATFGTGTTTTGSSGIQSTASVAWRGNAANLGGFFYFARFGVETHEAAMQYMVGLSALNAALTGEPSVQNNTLALCKDSTDSNWFFVSRDGTTTTKTATELAVATGTILDLTMFAPPNGSNVTVRLANAVNGTVYMDNVVITANLPVNTTFLFAHAQCRSTVGTTAKLLALNRIYVECDL